MECICIWDICIYGADIYIYIWYGIYIYIYMYGIYIYIYIYICVCPKKLPVPLQLQVFSPWAGFPIGKLCSIIFYGGVFSYSKDVHTLKLTSKAPENGWKRKTILLPFCDVVYFQGRKR